MNLRKEKAARMKVAILEHTLRLVGKKSFDDLYVDEICAKVRISKVTLFNYFPQKEDILLYFLRVWCLRRTMELREKPREGISAVYYLFEKLAEDFEQHPGFVLSLVGYLADLRRPPKPFPLKIEEKVLFFPDKEEAARVDILSLDQMLEQATLEAVFRKEITRTTQTRDITYLFHTAFFGSVVTAHLHHISPAKIFFKRNLDLLVKGLA